MQHGNDHTAIAFLERNGERVPSEYSILHLPAQVGDTVVIHGFRGRRELGTVTQADLDRGFMESERYHTLRFGTLICPVFIKPYKTTSPSSAEFPAQSQVLCE